MLLRSVQAIRAWQIWQSRAAWARLPACWQATWAKRSWPACSARYVCGAELGTLAAAYAGLGCILGHDYPFWHWFHGGKGVACNAAALILIWPMGGLFSCLIGLTAVLLTGYLPLGAVLIPAAFILPAFLEYGPELGFLTVIMTFIMLRQHAPGLRNMILGTEKKVDLPGMLR